MPNGYQSLSLNEAKQILEAGEREAVRLGIAYNIAVVDSAGHLIAFSRQDGALIGSIELAINKAKTARIFSKTTAYLSTLAQPGAPLFGIDQSNDGKVVIFGGGIPVSVDNQIVGAVGASAGTIGQDIAVAEAGITALGESSAFASEQPVDH